MDEIDAIGAKRFSEGTSAGKIAYAFSLLKISNLFIQNNIFEQNSS